MCAWFRQLQGADRGQAQIIDGELRFQGLVASRRRLEDLPLEQVDTEKIGREAGEEDKAEEGGYRVLRVAQLVGGARVRERARTASLIFPVSMMTANFVIKNQVAGDGVNMAWERF